MPADPVAILQDLVRCPSVTPAEGGALAYLERVLTAAGFAVDRPVFSETGTPDVENLFAFTGAGGPHLMFAGHTDVVPTGPEERWTHPPFSGAIDGGILYGRGSADMKGGIACFLAATLDWLAEKPRRGTISFLITGDEEGPAVNGTVKLLQWAAERGHRFDAAIVGEPTNPESIGEAIKVGRRGSVSGTITVTGRQGHVAHPHNADNPLPRLVALVNALIAERFDEGSERFQRSNLEITSIDVGNRAFNVIPASGTAKFNIRFTDRWTYETLTARIRTILDGVHPGGYHLAFERFNSPAFFTVAGALVDPLLAAIEEVTGMRPERSTSGGTSDARFIKDYCPVVEFGLVAKTIHRIDEQVPVADLHTLTRIYRRFLDRYFGTD
ncbi:MAG: succinyl-diaminopimelate desuccinylase [Bauldia sp.]|nr:succinyl-diaminopimelate desuccinylase [Bauldia sp.]